MPTKPSSTRRSSSNTTRRTTSRGTTGRTTSRSSTGSTRSNTSSTSRTRGTANTSRTRGTSKTTSTTRGSSRKTTTGRTTSTRQSQTWPASKFTGVRQTIQSRVGSYRNIYSQVQGPGQVSTFSPRTAQQWTNQVNKGACVYKFNSQQIARACGQQWTTGATPTAATQWLRGKFGKQNIVGVARGRGNTWLVATNGPINQGPFRTYTWK